MKKCIIFVIAGMLGVLTTGCTIIANKQPTNSSSTTTEVQASANENDEIAELQKSAEAGDADAQVRLGEAYLNGHGVEKDTSKAAEWYQKAVDAGYTDAQTALDRVK